MTTTLSDILEATRRSIVALRARRTELEAAARRAPLGPVWSSAFTYPDVAVVAEVKRCSPTAGTIAADFEPARQATQYVAGGARAISVLTDEEHFGGSLADLEAVGQVVSAPVLRKDFILDPIQLYETRAAGASAVLLIVRALAPNQLKELSTVARELGLGRLVEVHTVAELDDALALDPETVGVNSRDLETFQVDVDGLRAVLCGIPSGAIAVAESGLRERVDVERVARWGADAVLVGTALAQAHDAAEAVRCLTGVPRQARS